MIPDKEWNRSIQILADFKEEHGSLAVIPVKKEDDAFVVIRDLINKLRRAQKVYDRNGATKILDADRIQQLDDMFFLWRIRSFSKRNYSDEEWKETIERFAKYKVKYGDIHVVKSKYVELYNVCKYFRDDYKDFDKGKAKALTTERVRELNEMGFV